jgi:DNA-binding transcriptional regulator YiaG
MSTNIIDYDTHYKPYTTRISTTDYHTSKFNTSSTSISDYQNLNTLIIQPNNRFAEVLLKLIGKQVGTGGSMLAMMAAYIPTTGGIFYSLKPPLILNINNTSNYGDNVSKHETEIYSPRDTLSTIRSHLSLSMKEIAQILKVERQTVYAWIGGSSEPHPSNRNRLKEIYLIAKHWRTLSSSPIGNLVRQIDSDGKCLVELLSEDILDNKQIINYLQLLAESQGDSQKAKSKSSARELVAKHKINVKESNDTIDWLTGKRIDIE